MTFRFCVLLSFLLLSDIAQLHLHGQELPLRHIAEVTVVQGNREYFSDDQTIHAVPNRVLEQSRFRNLGYVLERHTPAMIRTYGAAGSLSSVSFHGTSSNHTQVSWNGFELNSPSTGQADLALVPAGFMQKAILVSGASGSLYGSGTFGGAVCLDNQPDWNNRVQADYAFHTGSFGYFGHGFSLKTGNEKLQFHLSALTSKATNHFTYRDHYMYQSPEREQQHNATRNIGLIHNVFWNLKRGHHLEAGLWYQHKILEIPALMGSYKPSLARQKDSTFRSYISFRKISEHASLVIRSAYFSDHLQYTDKGSILDTMFSINSRITSSRLMNMAEYRRYVSSLLTLGGGLFFNRIEGRSGNYGGDIIETEWGCFSSAKLSLARFEFNAGLRKEFYRGMNPPIQYSLGVSLKPSNRFVIRTGFSSKFRKPTFNEKYWQPGGNPLLKPERGKGGNLSVAYTVGQSEGNFSLSANADAYCQWVDNWIQWVYDISLNTFVPIEYKRVRSQGLDASVDAKAKIAEVIIEGSVIYSLNRSVVTATYDANSLNEGHQMMYVPMHVLRVMANSSFRSFSLGLASSFTGRCETVETADPQLRLPHYILVDLQAGYHKNIRRHRVAVDFVVNNLLGVSYEVIRAYPMPGRSYSLTLSIGFEKVISQQ
jgi:outer membrane cobalamin receptor